MIVSYDVSRVYLPFIDKPFPDIEDFLVSTFPAISRECWNTRINHGLVLTDSGHPVVKNTPYIPGSFLYYHKTADWEPRIPFQEKILYHDTHILVACKPHFLPVIPSGKYINECLLVRLKQKTGLQDLSPLHRIDRETAGLVLFSTNKKTRGLYQTMFMKKTVAKTYEAVTVCLEKNLPLKPIVRSRLVRGYPWFRMESQPGENNSESNMELVERHEHKALVRIFPVTGKKHQIRVHLSNLGYPILNDRFYPHLHPEKGTDFSAPLQLLAKKLEFTDPVSGEKKSFTTSRNLNW